MSSQPSDSKPPIILPVLIFGLLVIAAIVRLWELGAESFWYDEFILIEASNRWADVMTVLQEGRPPAILFLGYLWGSIFGFDEVGIRSLPAVMGIASLAVLYFISKRLFNWQIALISTLLATFSGFLVYHSQDYRYYSLLTFTSLLSYFFFIQWLWTGKRGYSLPYVLCTALAYYAHVFGIFVILAQGIFFLLRWGRYRELRRQWIMSQVAIALLTLPHFLTVFLGDFAGGSNFAFLATVPNNNPLFVSIKFVLFNDSYLRPLPFAIGGVIFIIGLGYAILRQRGAWFRQVRQDIASLPALFTSQTDSTLLVLTWFLAIMVVPYLIGFITDPIFLDRYVIASAPAFFLILAVGLWSFRQSISLYATVGALLCVMIFGLTGYYAEPTKEEWRRGFTQIAENETQDDIILYNIGRFNESVIVPYRFANRTYYTGDLEVCPYYEDRVEDETFLAELSACVGEADHIWVVMREYNQANQRIDDMTAALQENLNASLSQRHIYFGLQLVEYTRP